MDEQPKKRRGPMLVAVLILVFSSVASIWWLLASDPLRKSDSIVREWILSKTPRGSSIADVRLFLDQHGWNDERFHATRPRPAKEPFLGGEIGGYQGLPWWVSVRAFWEFDDTGRLANIRIERIYDAP